MSAVEPKGRFFLDTNVFVYSFDRESQQKQAISRHLIATALSTQRGVISTQVVQEFLNVALRRFAHLLSAAHAREYLGSVLAPLCLQFPSIAFYSQALVIQVETGYSWYDALIVAAALELGCDTLFSEDLQDGRTIRGLAIINPYIRHT
jgi:predicted nucleic acid-binding protein